MTAKLRLDVITVVSLTLQNVKGDVLSLLTTSQWLIHSGHKFIQRLLNIVTNQKPLLIMPLNHPTQHVYLVDKLKINSPLLSRLVERYMLKIYTDVNTIYPSQKGMAQ